MIVDNLIKECSCGEKHNFKEETINDIHLLTCNSCGTAHQYLPGWTQDMVSDFYKKRYHSEEQLKIGLREYKDRYDHDYKISLIRLQAYQEYLTSNSKGLDIGSSNSAFVHAANNQGYNFVGIDPGKDIGDDAVTIRSTIEDYDFKDTKFNVITMHDSFEHMVDVRNILKKIVSILESKGKLIIDIPDYYTQAGRHHWRPVQHLWYWNQDQMIHFLQNFSLTIIKITNPIPGKLVFYAEK